MPSENDAGLTADWANLDFLRSLAVLSVLSDHLLKILRITPLLSIGHDLGRLGVLLFFVHTSLVLMLSLERSEKARSSHPFREFYIRRAFRIYPLCMVIVLVTVILGVPNGHDAPVVPTARTVLSNLALVQNLAGAPSVVGPLWSLPIEVQMYLVLPLLYRFARRHAAYKVVWLGVGLAGLGLAYPYAIPKVPGLWRLDIISYAPCFVAGILAYSLARRSRVRFPAWMWPPFVAAVMAFYILWQTVSPIPVSRYETYRGWVVCWLVGAFVTRFGELTLPGCARYAPWWRSIRTESISGRQWQSGSASVCARRCPPECAA